jgi:cyclase
VYVESEATRMYEEGLSVEEAARAIDLSPYAEWDDAERIIVAIDTMYRDLAGDTSPRTRLPMFDGMAKLAGFESGA